MSRSYRKFLVISDNRTSNAKHRTSTHKITFRTKEDGYWAPLGHYVYEFNCLPKDILRRIEIGEKIVSQNIHLTAPTDEVCEYMTYKYWLDGRRDTKELRIKYANGTSKVSRGK